jgi:hypothetical protein
LTGEKENGGDLLPNRHSSGIGFVIIDPDELEAWNISWIFTSLPIPDLALLAPFP